MKINKFLLTTILSAGLALGLNSFVQAQDNRAVVHDARNNIVKNEYNNCVRTKWATNADECGTGVVPVTTRLQVPDEERTAYFQFDKSELLSSEKQKLNTLASALKSMEGIEGVSIVGYADRIGSESYNENLSKKRAKVVESYLKERGYLNTTIAKTHWLGKTAPIAKCEQGLERDKLITCLQADRRVTVEIQYKDKTITSYVKP